MKIKKLFEKVETYNEVAELMHTNKAQIAFIDGHISERFTSFGDFRKYIRREYIKCVADAILNSDAWSFEEGVEVYHDGWTHIYSAELIAG